MSGEAGRAIRVLIVDDEAPARARLKRLLAELEREGPGAGDVEVVGEAASGDEAVERILELVPDLVLLDIQMPGRDGFGVIEAVGPEAMPLVAFATAYDEHALRAFEVHALDYLLKPVRVDRLRSVVERARKAVAAAEARSSDAESAEGEEAGLAEKLAGLLTTMERPGGYLRRILVHHDERAFLVPVSQIVRISADRNSVRLHVVGGQELTVRTAISAIEGRLDPDVFVRLNRSDIVRVDAIRELHPWSHGDYHAVLTDGTRVVWSRRYRDRVEGRFGV